MARKRFARNMKRIVATSLGDYSVRLSAKPDDENADE
jgi:hypothetical protein